MATVLEALMNAQINLGHFRNAGIQGAIGCSQLDNAVTLLQKGYSVHTDVEELLDKHDTVKAVPKFES